MSILIVLSLNYLYIINQNVRSSETFLSLEMSMFLNQITFTFFLLKKNTNQFKNGLRIITLQH